MKKLIVAAMLSLFSFTAAAYACDGMKAEGKSDSASAQAKKPDKKADSAKTDQKS